MMSATSLSVDTLLNDVVAAYPSAEESAALFSSGVSPFTRFQERIKELTAISRSLSPAQQVEFVVEAARMGAQQDNHATLLQPLMSAVLRRKLAFSEPQILDLLKSLQSWQFGGPLLPVLTAIGRHPLTPSIASAIRRLHSLPWLQFGDAEAKKVIERIEQLLGPANEEEVFRAYGSWSAHIEESLTNFPAPEAIKDLLLSGRAIRSAKPSNKWRAAAAELVAQVGREEFRTLALDWLALGPDPVADGSPVASDEADYQRALVWSLAEYSDRELCAALASFAEQCLKKIPNFGPVSEKAGNGCINVLAIIATDDALGQLVRLGMRIKYQTAQRLINRALEEAAERAGLSREELEEITVPDMGLDAAGWFREAVGDYQAEFSALEPVVRYRSPYDKVVKSLPSAIREEHADAVKRLRRDAKNVAAFVTAQRLRLERLLMAERTIPLATWRKHYLEHPLLSGLTRRLIWRFTWDGEERIAIPSNDGLAEWNGQLIDPPDDSLVQLWHPIDADVQSVLSWRCWLEDNQVQQPFKQAHREVYVLTDAERETANHSNRFAAHILSQHQFAALAHSLGWQFTLMGMWDSHNTPYLDLPSRGLQVQFLVDGAGLDDHTAHGVNLYLTTDQVRFVNPDTLVPVELTEIPVRLFSEIMRDVDLFVSVSSVGSDPNWMPGQIEQFDAYWQSFSFGELSVSAESRRDTLERLLPKLPIRDRCTIDGRFLVVTGQRATYKIHLGSGNVMMEPGSRYLCIVRGPSTAKMPSRVFLPFEGDATLALILSKAFLLADDLKIKDASIL